MSEQKNFYKGLDSNKGLDSILHSMYHSLMPLLKQTRDTAVCKYVGELSVAIGLYSTNFEEFAEDKHSKIEGKHPKITCAMLWDSYKKDFIGNIDANNAGSKQTGSLIMVSGLMKKIFDEYEIAELYYSDLAGVNVPTDILRWNKDPDGMLSDPASRDSSKHL